MKVDIGKVKSDIGYRIMVRRMNERVFFILGSIFLLVLIAFVIGGAVSYVAGWFAIVGIVVVASSFLASENPISTAIEFVRLYRKGFLSFLENGNHSH